MHETENARMEIERVDLMELHEHFLEPDLKQASIHYSCFKDCLLRVSSHIDQGEMESAKHRATDMLKSLHELSKLNDKKRNHEKEQTLMNQLIRQGIDMQLVRVYFGKEKNL